MAPFLQHATALLSLAAAGQTLQRRDQQPQKSTTKVCSQPSFFPESHSKRVTIKYEPVVVPPMSENDGMGGFFDGSTTLPCRDCIITWMQMGLEHANGTTADANTGMWLHHGIMVNMNRKDAVCGLSAYGQRFSASGNERTPLDLSASGTVKTGYYIGPEDQVALSVDLMNMLHSQPQEDIVFTVTYEYIQGRHARKFSAVTPYWLDVTGCGSSEVPAHRDTSFEYSSPPVRGLDAGSIVFAAGHLHDGGTRLELIKNGDVVCDVGAIYDAYQYSDIQNKAVTEHVSRIETCVLPSCTTSQDEWHITAYYNTSLHEPMEMMDGSLEPVMGISLVYVAPGLKHHRPHRRRRCMNFVLGLGSGAVAMMLVAAWYWFRRHGRPKESTTTASGLLSKDYVLEGEAAMPLMKN